MTIVMLISISHEAYSITKKDPPNVIIFLVDDLGWNDTSLPMAGEPTLYNKRYKTPNLEKLANEGIMLTNAHAQPLCVPSRASLLSGQNFLRHNVLGDYDCKFSQDDKMMIPPGEIFNPDIALPMQLRKQGYKTIHVGKYHLCEHVSKYPTPERSGFDVNIAGSNNGAPGSYLPEEHYQNKNNAVVGMNKYYDTKRHLTDALTDEAIREMKQAKNENKPFFLYLAHYAIHKPLQAHKPYIDNYNLTAEENPVEALYASMIEGVDNSLGRVMKSLKDMGIDDNTMVIFFSDNGGLMPFRKRPSLYGNWNFNYPLRSGKASLFEGGVRVPGVIRWPHHTLMGTKTDAPIMIEDIYATVMNVCGATLPENHEIDGLDLTQLISGKEPSKRISNRSMYFFFPYRLVGSTMNGKDFPIEDINLGVSVVKNGWKLIYHQYDEHFSLYNLNVDISEKNNVLEDNMEVAYQLVKDLNRQFELYNPTIAVHIKEQRKVTLPLEAFIKNFNL